QISLDDVSEHVHRSRSYITARFKKEIGKTINEYIIDRKLSKAKSLLKNTDRSLSEIAYFLCFSTQTYFHTLFKKKYGITPNEYRKSHSK
ncbi:MAG: helix-turn-helix transcriptional regulator, partial [Bacilli bacterium]|nr:helix-turn-helix transcriptional regulator [Bacilli bacterium]